ncbi:Fic family protein [Methylorubrum thiocyanatum]|uniref:Fic/DOC family protein n=1 Tax=Methylorubrum thiocyanatum TaxID=47958 RepID=UPI003F822846
MSAEDPYVYPGTDVLRNRYDMRNGDDLAVAEQLASRRALMDLRRDPPPPSFDFAHYQDIHRRLFSQVYEWAGEPRTIDLWKAEIVLQGRSVAYSPPNSIRADAERALGEMRSARWTDLTKPLDAARFAATTASLWRAHPFREGNTRTLLAFVEQYGRHHGHTLDQAIINRVPSETRDALALASTGHVQTLATLVMEARRSELQRSHPELGRLSSEAVEIVRLMGNPRIVQPEPGTLVRGPVLTTSYDHVLVHEGRRIAAVPKHSFPEPPETNRRVAVQVLGPEERPDRAQYLAREQADRRELAAAVLIPAALIPTRGADYDQQRRESITIPAPSEALAKAFAERSPREIAADKPLMDEVRAIQNAFHERFGRAGTAVLAVGEIAEASKLLPMAPQLAAARAVLEPIRAVELAQVSAELSQSRKQSLKNEGPNLGQGS